MSVYADNLQHTYEKSGVFSKDEAEAMWSEVIKELKVGNKSSEFPWLFPKDAEEPMIHG